MLKLCNPLFAQDPIDLCFNVPKALKALALTLAVFGAKWCPECEERDLSA